MKTPNRDTPASSNIRAHLWRALKARGFFGLICQREYTLGPLVADLWLPEAKTAIRLNDTLDDDITIEQKLQLAAWLDQQGIQLLSFDALEVLSERAAVLQSICRGLEARLKIMH